MPPQQFVRGSRTSVTATLYVGHDALVFDVSVDKFVSPVDPDVAAFRSPCSCRLRADTAASESEVCTGSHAAFVSVDIYEITCERNVLSAAWHDVGFKAWIDSCVIPIRVCDGEFDKEARAHALSDVQAAWLNEALTATAHAFCEKYDYVTFEKHDDALEEKDAPDQILMNECKVYTIPPPRAPQPIVVLGRGHKITASRA